MKKLISIILTMLLLLGLMTVAVSAEDKTVIKGDTVYADAGEQVSVALKITENVGFCTMVLRISYDEDALTLVSMENKASGMTFTKPNSDPYDSGNKYLWDSLSVYSATGEFVILTFDVADSAEARCYDISVEFVESFKLDGNNIKDVPVLVSGAKIYVGIDETEARSESQTETEAVSESGSEIEEAPKTSGGCGSSFNGGVILLAIPASFIALNRKKRK